jgi:hypothetical protein
MESILNSLAILFILHNLCLIQVILFVFVFMEVNAKLHVLIFESLFYFLISNEVRHCFYSHYITFYETIYFFREYNICLQIILNYNIYQALLFELD